MYCFLRSLYPNKCPFCGNIICKNTFSCGDKTCNSELSLLKVPFFFDGENFINISPYSYEGSVKKAIWKFKFRNHKEYANPFSIAVNQALKKHLPLTKIDLITSVPLCKSKMKSRGYNQTELLAKELSKTRKEKYKQLIFKNSKNLEQHTLSLEKRKENIKGVYSIKGSDIMKGKKVLLCDDIITTGNTMGECRKLLLKHGASEVFCTTIAVVKSNIRS